MYFQLVDNQVLSTQGQHDVNLHRLTQLRGGTSPASDISAASQGRACFRRGIIITHSLTPNSFCGLSRSAAAVFYINFQEERREGVNMNMKGGARRVAWRGVAWRGAAWRWMMM